MFVTANFVFVSSILNGTIFVTTWFICDCSFSFYNFICTFNVVALYLRKENDVVASIVYLYFIYM